MGKVEKFAVYGGEGFDLDAEVRGTVVEVDPPEGNNRIFYLVPDENYRHLLVRGNELAPQAELPPRFIPEDGYQWYADHVIAHGYGGQPIIKLETYGLERSPELGRPATAAASDGPPSVLENGATRPLRVHDRVRVRGQYVFDYSHPMYWEFPTPSFVEHRGIYELGYCHAEIHPYRYDSIALLDQLDPIEKTRERHLVAAPIYPARYTTTWFGNLLGGRKGVLDEDTRLQARTARFTLIAPPRPQENMALDLDIEEERFSGVGNVTRATRNLDNDRVEVTVTVWSPTTDLAQAAVSSADYSLRWVTRGSDEQCARLRDEIAREVQRHDQLRNELQGLDPGERLLRQQLSKKLTEAARRIDSLRAEARALGCGL